MIELPFIYKIEGLPYDYLIFRTEPVPDSRDLLVTLVPNSLNQSPLDIVTMLISDKRLSLADRPHSAVATLRDVEAWVTIAETEEDDRVEVTVIIAEHPPVSDDWRRKPGGVFYARTDVPREVKQAL